MLSKLFHLPFYLVFVCAFTPSSLGAQPLKVGIIGAGISGFYSALLLQSVGIDYEILEGSDRAGGRIYTHYFNPKKWSKSKPGEPDYYDYFVGSAMLHWLLN